MRIITGSAKGMKLFTLDGDEITRPTPERVKEAIFNMLAFDIEDRRVLDLFAGSGQMGLEALSRGAASALFCDVNAKAAEIVRKNALKTKLNDKAKVLNTDYKAAIKGCTGREKFDVIFLDAPYAMNLVQDAIDRILRADLAAPGAIFVCESDSDKPFHGEGLRLYRHNRYGRIYITVLINDLGLGDEEEEGSADERADSTGDGQL